MSDHSLETGRRSDPYGVILVSSLEEYGAFASIARVPEERLHRSVMVMHCDERTIEAPA